MKQRTLPELLEAIRRERERQDCKWGFNLIDEPHMLSVLVEEVGEVAKEVNEARYHLRRHHLRRYSKNIKTELIQVAACAVKWIELLEASGL